MLPKGMGSRIVSRYGVTFLRGNDGVTLPAGGLGHLFTGLLRQLGEVAVIG